MRQRVFVAKNIAKMHKSTKTTNYQKYKKMNFTVYKSSAGSGKTFTLVKEYLKMALAEPVKFKEILAITFTNKAASEMKERILSSLKDLSEQPININTNTYKSLLPVLVDETGLTEEQISENASRILKLILHNYDDFAVSTIDSFAHRIIRSFAFDLRIPMNFDVDTDDKKMLEQAVNLLISKTGRDENITKTLVEFTESRTDQEKSWNIENELYRYSSILLEEDSQKNITSFKNLTPADFICIREILAKKTHSFENVISDFGKRTLDLFKNNNVDKYSFFQGEKGIGKYFEYLSEKRIDKIKTPNSFVLKTIHEDKWLSGKAEKSDHEKIEGLKPEIINLFNAAQKYISENYADYILADLIYQNAYQMAVLNEIEKIIEEIRKEKNIVHISEFNKRIAEVVQHEPVPFIYERTGEKYKNYLIDEFQDTSVMQWQNLLPLVDNALSEGHFTMLVGDGKQAIYRFRNGEVRQFVMLPEIYKSDNAISKEREKSLIRNYEEKQLDKNFRSKAEIVEFNNKFFSYVKSNLTEINQEIYINHEQKFDPINTGGLVSIEFLDDESKQLSKNEIYLQRVENLINELKTDHYKISDITILCRANKDAAEIASYIINQGINVISPESVLLTNSKEIRFIISLLTFLNKPDHVSISEIVYYLSKNKYLEEKKFNQVLFSLKKESNYSKYLYLLLKENGIDFTIEVLKSLPLYELTEELIRTFYLDRKVNIYLTTFLDEVQNYTQKNDDDLSRFLEYWEENKNKCSIKIPEGTEAIQVMTIHKSKGLEFPVVIYPFAEEISKITKKSLWIDTNIPELPQLKKALINTSKLLSETKHSALYDEEKNKSHLDLINMVYVAMTRPTERLYILSRKTKNDEEKNDSVQGILTGFLKSSGRWDDQLSVYNFGTKVLHEQKEKKQTLESTELNIFHSNDWRKRILLRNKAPEIWDVKDPEKNKTWGNLVHYLLSRIICIDDLETAVLSMQTEGLISAVKKNKLSEKISEILSNEKISKFFQKGVMVKNETEILLTNGKTYRPDRVVIDGNKAIVIDYKSGRSNASHQKQINKYAESLVKMGYSEIEKYIIYIEENKIEKIE